MITVLPLQGIPEVQPGDDLASLLGDALERAGGLEGGDVLVVSQKVVSKAEGRMEQTADHLEVILREARAVRRRRGDLVIAETEHGFVCASAGVDRSNTPGEDWVVLLPRDPDASAAALRDALAARFGAAPAVIVSDSFGRAWRHGQSETAIGCAGLVALEDWRGRLDGDGRTLLTTAIAVADEAAGAADLVRGKDTREPAVRLRGLGRHVTPDDGPGVAALLRPAGEDLFR